MLVAFLRLTGNRRLAVAITLVVWPLAYLAISPSIWLPSIFFAMIALWTLMRFGFLALVVFLAVDQTYLMSATRLTAWYTQPYLFAVLFVLLLVLYGFWASTSGRRFFDSPIVEDRT